MSTDVYHALQHSNRLVQHTLRVGDEVCNGQGTSIEVSLQKQIALGVGTLQHMLVNFQRHNMAQCLVQDVFVVSHGQSFELLDFRENVDK